MHSFWLQKKSPFDLPQMRDMVCDLGCAVAALSPRHHCNPVDPIDPHHSPGKSERPNTWSDLRITGLCRTLHNECEKIGDEAFQKKWGIDFLELDFAYIRHFIETVFEAGEMPEAKRAKKSVRKNRLPFEPYVPPHLKQ